MSSTIFEQPTLWQRLRPMVLGFDGTLTALIGVLA